MAAPVALTNIVVMETPFKVRHLTFTAGDTATSFAHGEETEPTLAWGNSRAVADAVAVDKTTSATNFTLDTGSASGTVDVILVWNNAAEGGGLGVT